jgi:hypothetical protein
LGFSTLLIRGFVQSAGAINDELLFMRFNGDTGSNYDTFTTEANSSGWSVKENVSGGDHISVCNAVGQNFSSRFSEFETFIMSYTNTTKFRVVMSSWANANASALARGVGTGNWRNTANAINRVVVSFSSNNIKAGSRFMVYVIL